MCFAYIKLTAEIYKQKQQALRSKFLVTAKGWYLQAFYFDFVKVFINFCCQPLSYDSGH